MRLGVFGGSFDPVHIGHLRMAEVARDVSALDTILFVPTQVSPFKTGRQVTPPELRLEMLRLAIAGNPAFAVSDIEVRRSGTSYTVDTLRTLAQEYPNAERFFLTGTDAVRDLTLWREPEEILRLARFLVMTRPGVDHANAVAHLPDTFRERIAFINMPGLDISSSFLRESLAAGRSVRYLIPDNVRAFITEKGLYRGDDSSSSNVGVM